MADFLSMRLSRAGMLPEPISGDDPSGSVLPPRMVVGKPDNYQLFSKAIPVIEPQEAQGFHDSAVDEGRQYSLSPGSEWEAEPDADGVYRFAEGGVPA